MSDTLIPGNLARPAICQNPVFIIGSPRSGTSILAWSLAQHSQLWTSGELHLLFGLFGSPVLKERIQRECEFPCGWLQAEDVSREEFFEFVGLGLNALFTSRSKEKRWIEQTPVNTLMVDVLSEMFPGAVFLHILRDGRDVVNSMMSFQNALTASERDQVQRINFYPPWAENFREACKTWRQSVQAAATFATSHPTRCLTIRYERLAAEPEERFREIFEFLSVPNEKSPAAFLRTNRLHSSLPKDQVTCGTVPPKHLWSQWSAEWKTIFEEEVVAPLVQCGLADAVGLAPTDYNRLVQRIREVVAGAVPAGASVLVVSKGDEALLNLPVRKAGHFPQDDAGAYAGHYPASSDEAISQIERLRARGAEYLIFPKTSMWWIEHYVEFRKHLERGIPAVWCDESCTIYSLHPAPSMSIPDDGAQSTIELSRRNSETS